MEKPPTQSFSMTFNLSVALGLVVMLCIGWAVAAFVFYRQATEARQEAAQAIAQEQAATKEVQIANDQIEVANQRAEQAKQLYEKAALRLAYLEHTVGVRILSDAELAVVEPSLVTDGDLKKLVDQVAADKSRFTEHYGPDGVEHYDYHTLLNSACDMIRVLKQQADKLNTGRETTLQERDEASAQLKIALKERDQALGQRNEALRQLDEALKKLSQ